MGQVVNFFWTILCFAPLVIYWFKANHLTACWYLIALSFLSMLIPARWLQLSRTPKFYMRAGVRFIRRFVQNGDLFKRGKPIVNNRAEAMRYKTTIAMYERYHFLCLVFFMATGIHALIYRQYLMAALITAVNIIYNVYPILLQQYNYARLLSMGGRTGGVIQ